MKLIDNINYQHLIKSIGEQMKKYWTHYVKGFVKDVTEKTQNSFIKYEQSTAIQKYNVLPKVSLVIMKNNHAPLEVGRNSGILYILMR